MSESRDTILNSVREAARIPSQMPEEAVDIDRRIAEGLSFVTPKSSQALKEQFKKELELVSGEFHLLRNVKEAGDLILNSLKQIKCMKIAVTGEACVQPIADRFDDEDGDIQIVRAHELSWPERKEELAEVSVSLVEAAYAIADTGSLVFLYDKSKTSLPHFLADCVFAIVDRNSMVANQFELFKKIPPEQKNNMVFVTGPSRTADIEKILILGAHGPRRLVVIMLEESCSIGQSFI